MKANSIIAIGVIITAFSLSVFAGEKDPVPRQAATPAALMAEAVQNKESGKSDTPVNQEGDSLKKAADPVSEKKSEGSVEKKSTDPAKPDPVEEKQDRERIQKEIVEKDKQERDRVEKEKAAQEKEKQDRERIEKERTEKDTKKKSKLSIVDLSTKEYIALFAGYGGFFPVADYGKRYDMTHLFSGTLGLYVINFAGFSPEFHVRYASMASKKDPMRYDSDLSLLQFCPGIIYRHHFVLPRNTLTLYGRIWDGVSRVSYSSVNSYIPIIKENIVENINVFGVSAGCYYDVWKGFLLGVDVSYSLVSTAGKPLHGMSLMVTAGWRIL